MSRVVGDFRKHLWLQASLLGTLLFLRALDSFPQSAQQRLQPRFTTYQEAKATVEQYRASGLAGSNIGAQAQWDQWIREQDTQVRSRIDRGVEDSISNFILYGVSFTKLPRLSGSDDALDQHGSVTGSAQARIHALVAALQLTAHNERLEFVREFLGGRKVSPPDSEQYLAGNLVRFAREQRAYQKTLDEISKSSDTNQVMSVRGSLYKERGLSADTSLLPNFAIEETLRAMTNKGVLKPGSIRRIAIVGPGLDFADKRDGYDFYPLQTLQPFAVLETVIRLGLAGEGPVDVITLDLNAAVNAHVAQLSSRGKKGQPYAIQLPRDTSAGWSENAVDYWKQFGTILGAPTEPLRVPDALPSLDSRAVTIRPEYAARMTPIDLNIVAQTTDLPDGDGFDLLVATNILVYYDLFQQALAMANITHTMNPGGIFLANNALPAAHDPRLKFLGRKQVFFAKDGSYGDDVFVYRRQ
jgi:hypothetical protein